MNAATTYRLARAAVLRKYPHLSAADEADSLESEIDDQIAEWHADAAHDLETFGGPEDAPCIEYGCGEGRYHGVIG